MDQAIATAIDLTIKEGLLVEWLKENYEEVGKMVSLEYNEQDEFDAIREDGRIEGREEGKIEVIKEILQLGIPVEDIAKKLNISLDVVEGLVSK